jgi:hypothetical protein
MGGLAKLVAQFNGAAEFLAAFEVEIARGGLLVRGASVENTHAGAACELSIEVAGESPVQVAARIAAVVPGVGVAVMFDGGVPEALTELAEAARNPAPADEPKVSGNLFDRLRAMSVTEKTQLALSGSRDERTALLRDNAKTVHVFVLKNPRIGLDEVQAAAKNPNLSPDALKMIAEHREWGLNPSVCTSLVRNAKTPLPLALKMLERVPLSDLRALAKGGAREQLVQAARRKIAAP